MERPMKTVLSIAVAVVMPFGLFVLAGVVVGRIIAKHRETRGPCDATSLAIDISLRPDERSFGRAARRGLWAG